MPKIKFFRYFFFFILACFFGFISDSHALSIGSTYRDTPPNNSNVTNLLALAQNYDSFKGSKFVIFSDTSDSYYIVWSSDLQLSNNVVTGSKIEYLRYYRISSNYSYQYVYGTDSSFRLVSNYHNTSNINGYGFVSTVNQQYDINYYLKYFLILITSFLFIIALSNVKRSVTI